MLIYLLKYSYVLKYLDIFIFFLYNEEYMCGKQNIGPKRYPGLNFFNVKREFSEVIKGLEVGEYPGLSK